MPRVNALKPMYMAKDIGARIKGMMFRAKITETAMASELGLTQGGFHYKLDNNAFSYFDLIVIFHELGATDSEILELMKV